MRRATLSLSLIALALAACAPQTQAAVPSPTTTPAETEAPPRATSTLTSIPAAAPTLAPPSRGVTILAPGSGSALQSPITLQALLQPDAERVHIELMDQGGALLYRRVLNDPGLELHERIDFNVRAEGDGRLTVLIFDAFGNNSFASSVALELLVDSNPLAADPGAVGEIIIDAPATGAELAGGQVAVSGQVSGPSARPLVIQLVNQAGRVLVSQEVYPGEMGADGYRPFAVDLSFNINEDSAALLTVSQSGGGVPGLWLLNSVEVLLLAE